MAKDKIEIEVIAKGLEKVQKDLEKLTKQGKQTKEGFMSMKSAAAAFAAIMTGVVVTAIRRVAIESARFIQSMDAAQKQFGVAGDKILKTLRRVSKGTIADTQLITSANRAMALNVTQDLDKMASLLEVARIRAKSMGIDTNQAFNDIVIGIGRQSPKILDNLGIMIKGFAATAKGMSQAEAQQLLLNKVLEDGQRIIRGAGEDVTTAAERFQQMSANIDNLKNSFGIALISNMDNAIKRFERFGTSLDDIEKSAKIVGRVLGTLIEIMVNGSKIMIDLAKALLAPFIGIGKALKALMNGEFKEALKIYNDNWDKAMNKAFKTAKIGFKNIKEAIDDLFKDPDLPKAGGDAGIKIAKELSNKFGENLKKNSSKLKASAKAAIGQAVQEIGSFMAEARVRGLDAELAALEKKHEAELAMLDEHKGKLNEITMQETASKLASLEEQKNAAIASGNEQAAKEKENAITRIEVEQERANKEEEINKEFEEKMNALKNKRAKAEHKAAIIQSIINTAVGGTLAFAQLGFPAGLIAAGIIHTLGAVQTGIIAANKPPEFRQGTDFAPSGPAIVGETGPELVELPQGSSVTPSNDTINNSTDNRNININVTSNNGVELVNELRQTYGFDVFAEA
jgi:hypothetical protein